MIDSFDGQYRWLSNFEPVPVKWGLEFASVEHAYQAAKCARPEDRHRFSTSMTAGQAKKLGRTMQLRPDWNFVKLRVMEYLLRQKFAPGTKLAHLLMATDGLELVEGNYWGDTFWGICNGKGQNHLGKLLMKIRNELVQGNK